jgi:hypothetical protein
MWFQIVEATSSIGAGQVIGEYTGNVMLRSEYEHNKQFDMLVVFAFFELYLAKY